MRNKDAYDIKTIELKTPRCVVTEGKQEEKQVIPAQKRPKRGGINGKSENTL